MGYFFRGLLVVLFFTCAVLFNIGLVDIRFEEINYLLGNAALDQDASNALGIIAKYELIKRRMEFGEEDVENYELEARIQALISGDHFTKDEEEQKKKKYLAPVKFLLNSIRFTLGKEIINPQKENKIIKVLEIGYFWERNRKYPEAIKIYNDVLDMPEIGPDLRSVVLMHKAFCHSMMSEYKKAMEVYEEVINTYPNTEAGVISWKLLDFIASIEEKRETVEKADLTNFERAKQYYLLMDYRNSIKYFSIFLQENKEGVNIAEARYFKGRSHEELGESDEAVNEYRYTIRVDKTKKWAREANRRMLMLGEFYDHQKKMAIEAKKQLAAYQDDSFMNKVDKYKEMVSKSSIRDEMINNYPGKLTKREGEKNIMGLIDSIGEIDLTGEKDRKKKEEEMDRYRRELVARGIKAREEQRMLELRKMLTSHASRRPSYLKKTIDGNIGQLQYIYNKNMLRKGIRLSGKMLVEISIQPNGSIGHTKIINSNMGDTEFEKKVLVKIKTWRFNAVPDSLGSLNIRYPFEFNEEL
jgi:TonB family protein